MKNLKFSAMLAVAALAFCASADWAVYWEVDGAYNMYAIDPDNNSINFSYATISAVDSAGSETFLYQYNSDGTKLTPEAYCVYGEDDLVDSVGPLYSGTSKDLGAGTSDIDYFYVRLYGASDEDLLGWRTYTMTEMIPHIWDTSGTGPQTSSPLTVKGVVPEPTSALLTLLGLASLALRRRRA